MKSWTKWARRWGLARDASPQEVLLAHIEALLKDPLAAAPGTSGPSLPMANSVGPRCVAVELGLSRIELYRDGDTQLRLETSGDALVLGTLPVEATRTLLEELGVHFSERRGVLQGHLNVSTRRERKSACAIVARLLVQLLETEAGHHFSVALERERIPHNPELIEQIKQLVKQQDIESRRLVYQSIVQGLFYLPVRPPEQEHTPPTPVPHDPTPGEAEVWAIYSDRDSLPKQPSSPFIVISGIRLIQAAHVLDLGSLQLNPGAKFGGELLRHELQSVGDYLRTLGMMNVGEQAPPLVS